MQSQKPRSNARSQRARRPLAPQEGVGAHWPLAWLGGVGDVAEEAEVEHEVLEGVEALAVHVDAGEADVDAEVERAVPEGTAAPGRAGGGWGPGGPRPSPAA